MLLFHLLFTHPSPSGLLYLGSLLGAAGLGQGVCRVCCAYACICAPLPMARGAAASVLYCALSSTCLVGFFLGGEAQLGKHMRLIHSHLQLVLLQVMLS